MARGVRGAGRFLGRVFPGGGSGLPVAVAAECMWRRQWAGKVARVYFITFIV